MKPQPRIRKTIKWGGAAVTVLLVVVWIGSGFRYFGYGAPNGYRVEMTYGWMLFAHGPPTAPRIGPYVINPKRFHLYGWWFDRYDFKGEWGFNFPLWLLCASSAFPTLLAWHLDGLVRRREREGKCPKCSYDRVGIPRAAICPECGSASE